MTTETTGTGASQSYAAILSGATSGDKVPPPRPAPTMRIPRKTGSNAQAAKPEPVDIPENSEVESLRLEVARLKALSSRTTPMEVEQAAQSLEAERAPVVDIRDAENNTTPRAALQPERRRSSPRPTHRGSRGGRENRGRREGRRPYAPQRDRRHEPSLRLVRDHLAAIMGLVDSLCGRQ